MKKTGICPRCESKEINGPYEVFGSPGMLITLYVSFGHIGGVQTFVCSNCGYVEYYANEKLLGHLRTKAKAYSP